MASFELYANTVSVFEGGYQNKDSDRGNFNSLGENVGTNHGISARFYENKIGRPPTKLDMLSITKDQAKAFFKNDFWNVLKANSIQSQAVAENIVDHGINSGPGTIAKIVQNVLNTYFGKNLKVDGSIGMLTVNAINNVNNQDKLFSKIAQYRLKDYEENNNKDWFKIWENRVFKLAAKFNISIEKKKYSLV